jgi:hypothetical protein
LTIYSVNDSFKDRQIKGTILEGCNKFEKPKKFEAEKCTVKTTVCAKSFNIWPLDNKYECFCKIK